jgi:hypothetical protein
MIPLATCAGKAGGSHADVDVGPASRSLPRASRRRAPRGDGVGLGFEPDIGTYRYHVILL